MTAAIMLEDHEKHIVLFAKGFYRRSDDTIQDLKALLSPFFAIEPKYFADSEMYGRVLETFWKVTSPDKQQFFWGEIFARVGKPSVTMTELVKRLLGELSICVVRKNDEVVLDLGEPDYTILPPS